MAEHQLPKLNTGVRFPSSAPDESPARQPFLPVEGKLAARQYDARATFVPLASRQHRRCGPQSLGKRAQAAIGQLSGAIPGRRCVAHRAGDVSHQGTRRQLPSRHAHRPRARQLDRPERWRRAAVVLRRHVASRRPQLRPRTRDLYRSLLRLHVLPTLGTSEMAAITPATVRSWRAGLISAGHPGASTIAKAYRMLHAVCGTAVEDGLIARNPCVIKGASVERPSRASGGDRRAGLRARRRHRAPVPSDGAVGDVLRPTRW